MSAEELRGHLRQTPDKTQRAMRKALATREAVAWIAQTWTAYEITRALREASKDATASPFLAFKGALEGTWRCSDSAGIERARESQAAQAQNAKRPERQRADVGPDHDRDEPLTDEEIAERKARTDRIWARIRATLDAPSGAAAMAGGAT